MTYLLTPLQALTAVANLAASELARVVVVFDDIDVSTLSWIALHHRDLAIAKGPDRLRLAIEIVVMNFAHQQTRRVLLDQVDRAIEVPIPLYLHKLPIAVSFDDVRALIAIGVEQHLVVTFVDAIQPLVCAAIGRAMGDNSGRVRLAGEEAESRSDQ